MAGDKDLSRGGRNPVKSKDLFWKYPKKKRRPFSPDANDNIEKQQRRHPERKGSYKATPSNAAVRRRLRAGKMS